VDGVLWLSELKSYTCVGCKLNEMYLNQAAPIYRCVSMRQVSERDRMENTAFSRCATSLLSSCLSF
jgi:hypothetical protein